MKITAQTSRVEQIPTTGELGSPSATNTITGKQLPAPTRSLAARSRTAPAIQVLLGAVDRTRCST